MSDIVQNDGKTYLKEEKELGMTTQGLTGKLKMLAMTGIPFKTAVGT